MAATLAQGTTVLDNAAIEPDITALAQILVECGARIEGIGSRRMTIHGVRSLEPIDATIIPDRIEAATFLAAAAISGGNITLEGCEPAHCAAVIHALEEAGADVLPEPGE